MSEIAGSSLLYGPRAAGKSDTFAAPELGLRTARRVQALCEAIERGERGDAVRLLEERPAEDLESGRAYRLIAEALCARQFEEPHALSVDTPHHPFAESEREALVPELAAALLAHAGGGGDPRVFLTMFPRLLERASAAHLYLPELGPLGRPLIERLERLLAEESDPLAPSFAIELLHRSRPEHDGEAQARARRALLRYLTGGVCWFRDEQPLVRSQWIFDALGLEQRHSSGLGRLVPHFGGRSGRRKAGAIHLLTGNASNGRFPTACKDSLRDYETDYLPRGFFAAASAGFSWPGLYEATRACRRCAAAAERDPERYPQAFERPDWDPLTRAEREEATAAISAALDAALLAGERPTLTELQQASIEIQREHTCRAAGRRLAELSGRAQLERLTGRDSLAAWLELSAEQIPRFDADELSEMIAEALRERPFKWSAELKYIAGRHFIVRAGADPERALGMI